MCVCVMDEVPVVVHVTDEHGVEGVKVSAEHSKLIKDEKLRLLVVTFTVGLQLLLLGHHLHTAPTSRPASNQAT